MGDDAKTATTQETQWFALKVLAGKERKVKEYVENEVKRSGWGHIVKQVLIPMEKVYKIVKGKKVIKERNFFPGYVLVEVVKGGLTPEMVQALQNITGVMHFIERDKPVPLRKTEVNRILGKVDEMQETGESIQEPFIIDETVRIIDGPFNDFLGTVEEINEEKKKLKVIVKIFGRRTPVELNFMQVEKIS
ncbi:MAG: transcription termination/antitermination protein NusG [Chitinophagales bacterium]|nr:MAG: transcription termination/antitermination protein NusG [Chitinophagales bacterium]